MSVLVAGADIQGFSGDEADSILPGALTTATKPLVAVTDRQVFCDPTLGSIILTLPAIVDGVKFFIKRVTNGGNSVTITGQDIDGITGDVALNTVGHFIELIGNAATSSYEIVNSWTSEGNQTEVIIKSLLDLAPYLVGTSYELPFGRYVFDQDIDLGTDNIKLIDGAFYSITATNINTVVYTGTGAMFDASVAGTALKMDDIFLSSPNCSETFLMTDGNSLLTTLVVCISKKVATLTRMEFVTLNEAPLVGSADGLECIDCVTISAKLFQWNDGADTSGVALTVSGALSKRLIMSTCDARPAATECYLDIQSTYAGLVSIAGGVFDNSLSGLFFKGAPSLDQTNPNIFVGGVINVPSSKTEIFGHFAGNATATTIAIVNTPVKINAGTGWTDVRKERFTFLAVGTWTYTGLESMDVSLSATVTVNPSGGGSKSISTYFAKNGTVDVTTRGNVTASAGGQITNIAIMSLVTGDTVEMFIENNTDTSNITVEVASIRIP